MNEGLEARLENLEASALRAVKAAKSATTAATAIVKHAQLGDLSRLRAAIADLERCEEQLDETTRGTSSAWSWTNEDEERYLEEELLPEVKEAAERQGIPLHRYGSLWSASPILIKLDSKSRALRLDRKKTTQLRPSKIVDELVKARRRRPTQQPDRFIELLHHGYRAALGLQAIAGPMPRQDAGVPVVEIHKSLTPLPESRRDYPIEDFARDLYLLDVSGVRTTKAGLQLYLASSSSSKSGGGVLTVLDDSGRPFHYFSAAFRSVSG